MKKYVRLLLVAGLFPCLIACGNLDLLQERVNKIENRVAALEKIAEAINGNIEALQAIASGQAINKVEEKDGNYVLTLSNGTQMTITQGSVGMGKAPLVSIDAEGYWMVDYQDGEGAVYITDDNGDKIVALGQNGVTPLFSVSADGYWTVSYNGGDSYAAVLDSNGDRVKAVAGDVSEDSYFAGVEYTDEALVLTLKNGEQYRVPVVGGFLCRINGASAEEVFRLGEKKTFSVEQKGIASTIITAPKDWDAYLTNSILSVQAPSTLDTKAVLADTRSDVSIVALSEAGHISIAKIRVSVDGTISVYDPAANVSMVEATLNTLKFNVTTENATSWYWQLRGVSESAPGAAELIANGTKGTDSEFVVNGLSGQTDYILYVIPCGDVSNGPVVAFKTKTSDYSTAYEAWEAGVEIKIGSQTYSKTKTGYTAQVVDGEVTAWTLQVNEGRVYFLNEGAVLTYGGGELTKSFIVISNVSGSRPTVKLKGQTGLTGTDNDFAFKGVHIETVQGMTAQRFGYSKAAIGRMILDDCSVDLKYPLLRRTGETGNMAGIEIIGCDVAVDWASDNSIPILVDTHVGGSSLGDLIVRNNVFWSKSGKKEFHLCSSPWGYNKTTFSTIVLENNTFYNLHNGLLSSGRDKALIMVSTAKSISTGENIAYDTDPEDKNTSSTPHFTWFRSKEMTLEALKAVTTVSGSSLINIAEYCGLWGSDTVEFGYGLESLITWQTGGYTVIDSWINPFASEDVANGTFTMKSDYAHCGPQR